MKFSFFWTIVVETIMFIYALEVILHMNVFAMAMVGIILH